MDEIFVPPILYWVQRKGYFGLALTAKLIATSYCLGFARKSFSQRDQVGLMVISVRTRSVENEGRSNGSRGQ